MCIRDSDGGFVLARSTWFSPLCSIDLGEAMGLFSSVAVDR